MLDITKKKCENSIFGKKGVSTIIFLKGVM